MLTIHAAAAAAAAFVVMLQLLLGLLCYCWLRTGSAPYVWSDERVCLQVHPPPQLVVSRQSLPCGFIHPCEREEVVNATA